VRELREQCNRVAINPRGYRQRNELSDGIRSCAHGNYVIFFEIESDALRVVRILHGARDLQAQFGQDIGQDS
jgi:toxin ParE1/3/4